MVLSYLGLRNNSPRTISIRDYKSFIIMINGNSRLIGITFASDKFCNNNLFCNNLVKNKCSGYIWANNQLFWAVCIYNIQYNRN